MILIQKGTDKTKMGYKGIILDFNGTMVWDTLLHKEAWLHLAGSLVRE